MVTATRTAIVGQQPARLPNPGRKRPALAALALLLILGGALTSAWLVYRSGDRVDVLVAREDILPGQLIAEDDFAVARVATDDAPVIVADAANNFVGSYATGRIPAGTLLNRTRFSAADVVPDDAVVVGVVLSPQQRPAAALEPGDVVRVYLVPPDEAGGTVEGSAGDTIASAVTVVEVSPGAQGADSMAVSLLVPEQQSGRVVAAASANQLAVARLGAGTEPLVNLRQD